MPEDESIDEFTREYSRTIARIGAVVVVLVLIYYLFSSILKLDRGEILGIIREAISASVARVA